MLIPFNDWGRQQMINTYAFACGDGNRFSDAWTKKRWFCSALGSIVYQNAKDLLKHLSKVYKKVLWRD